MKVIKRILHTLPALFGRRRMNQDIDEELALHIDLETAENVRAGMTQAAARRAALVKFGGVDRYSEACRDTRGVTWFEELLSDLRLSLRLLAKAPQFTLATLLTLGLGMGANTAIFSVVNSVLLRASPFADPDQLVVVWETDRASKTEHEPASWPDVVDLRERSQSMAAIGSLMSMPGTLAGAGDPERVSILGVTSNIPELLGVRPLIGQTFASLEVVPNGAQYGLLSEELWRRRFNGDPSVVGRTITLNERPTTIVGVLPAEADLGIRQIHERADYGTPLAAPEVELWLALAPTAEETPRSTHPFLTIGRLAPNATLAGAQRELASIMADIERANPENIARGVNLESYDVVTFGPVRPALFVLLGAVALVLLVACVNVANLLLARTAVRAREVAVRRALGAATGRIVRQFLAESMVLTVAGALVGLLVANVVLKALVALAPTDIPRLASATIDARVLGFTALVSGLVAFAFGMAPTLVVRKLDLQSMVKAQSSRGSTEGHDTRRFRGGLVVAEIALAVCLVIGASVLLRSFWKLANVDPGFQTTNITKFEFQLLATRYPTPRDQWPNITAINGFHSELLRRVQALPGIESAALAGRHPLDAGFTNSFAIVGREAESGDFPEIRTRFITPEYLQTVGVSLLAGRALSAADQATATPVVLINRAAAQAYFKGRDPIGQQIRFWGTPRQIVGVISDERFKGLAEGSEPAVYTPMQQAPMAGAVLLVRSQGSVDPTASVRRVFQELDPQLAIYGVEPLEQTVSASIARARFTALLLGLFAAVAMLLALVGVHGVLSYNVARRAPEIGIRIALGATQRQVVNQIIGEGTRQALLGIALGAAAALAGSQLLSTLVFGVTPRDPLTYLVVPAGVLALAVLASWLPARRAAQADPIYALRAD